MEPFRRRSGAITSALSAHEAALIAGLSDQVRALLSDRRAETPDDPLIAVTGMTVGPATPPTDAVVARLLPDFTTADPELAAGLRELHEPTLIEAKDRAAARLLATLPADGGTVRLTDEDAALWLTALNDIRLALGVRLDISDDDELPAAVRDGAPDSPEGVMYATYRWLSAVLDSLVTVLMD